MKRIPISSQVDGGIVGLVIVTPTECPRCLGCHDNHAGCSAMEALMVWDHEVLGSSPNTPIKEGRRPMTKVYIVWIYRPNIFASPPTAWKEHSRGWH